MKRHKISWRWGRYLHGSRAYATSS